MIWELYFHSLKKSDRAWNVRSVVARQFDHRKSLFRLYFPGMWSPQTLMMWMWVGHYVANIGWKPSSGDNRSTVIHCSSSDVVISRCGHKCWNLRWIYFCRGILFSHETSKLLQLVVLYWAVCRQANVMARLILWTSYFPSSISRLLGELKLQASWKVRHVDPQRPLIDRNNLYNPPAVDTRSRQFARAYTKYFSSNTKGTKTLQGMRAM